MKALRRSLSRERAPMNNTAHPFTVTDNTTGERPDCGKIASVESWAEGLNYRAIDGFYIGEDGRLSLMDEFGNARWCPEGRFSVVFGEEDRRWYDQDTSPQGLRLPICGAREFD